MRLKNTVFFLAGLVLMASSANAVPSEALGLGFKDALKIADERNADILHSKDRLEEAVSRVTQARSYFFPDVSAGVSENRQTVNLETFGIPLTPTTPALVGPFNVFDARVRLTQTLFDLSMIQRFRAAEAGREMSRAESRKVRQDVLALAGTLFVQARRAQSRVDYAKENLKLAAARRKILRQRLGLGTASETESKSGDASLSQARYAWRAAVSDASASLLELKTVLGFSPEQSLDLLDSGTEAAGLPSSSVIRENASRHPDVEARRAGEKFEEKQEAAERASFLPSVQGTANYGANGRTVGDSRETYLYGVQASWDIFDFGRRLARVREAAARSHEAKTDFDQSLREAESKIYQARDAVKNAERSLRANEDNWLYEKSYYGTVKTRVAGGSASRLDLIVASVSLAQAADGREEARSLRRIAAINLCHALGKMDDLLEEKTG